MNRKGTKVKMKVRVAVIMTLLIVTVVMIIGCKKYIASGADAPTTEAVLTRRRYLRGGGTYAEADSGSPNGSGKALTVDPENWDPARVTKVTSEDGIVVPVPKGFTISTDVNERYVNGTWIEKKGNSANIEWSTGGTYPWTQNATDGIWQSGNYNVKSTTSKMSSNEIQVGANGGRLQLEWSVSSRSSSGVLTVTITNTETEESEDVLVRSGTTLGTSYSSLEYIKYSKELEEGKYIVNVKYAKNTSTKQGLDKGYIKSGTIFEYNETGSESVTLRGKSGGFVIYEGTEAITDLWTASKTRNQFVWVPVKNASNRIYEEDSNTGKIKAKLWNFTEGGRKTITNDSTSDLRFEPGILNYKSGSTYGEYDGERVFNKDTYSKETQGYTKDMLYKELEIEYKNTIKSIEKYGGFYIGRYETGGLSQETPVVRRMNEDIGSQTWYTMYNRMKNISTNQNIQTSMIWGSLFDETLQWLIDTGEKTQAEIATDSSSWGNYVNSRFQYYNNNGELTNTKSSNTIPAGSAEYTKANNIYDLAGNVWDWTLEGNGSYYRCLRGGGFSFGGTGGPAQYRVNDYPYNNSDNYGFRAYFYIK